MTKDSPMLITCVLVLGSSEDFWGVILKAFVLTGNLFIDSLDLGLSFLVKIGFIDYAMTDLFRFFKSMTSLFMSPS